MPAAEPTSAALARKLQRLGLVGMVLAAAVIVDLAILVPASLDDVGRRWVDLLALPGMLGMAWCAYWSKHRPVAAAFAGSAVLIASTVLIRMTDAPVLTTLVDNASFTETVAAVVLVVQVVCRARADLALVSVTWLTLTSLLAVFGRASSSVEETRTFGVGLVLLVAAVGYGLYLRRATLRVTAAPLPALVREQWPMIGLLTLPLFADLSVTVEGGLRAVPPLVLSAISAVLAVSSTRRPLASALASAAAIALCAGLMLLIEQDQSTADISGIPIGQVASGLIVVVNVVRWEAIGRAVGSIGAMSAAVIFGVLVTKLTISTRSLNDLVIWFGSGTLLLGIAVAVGLYFRARDRERAQVLSTAVTEAQTSERMALARELHDVVAHHVTGIVVQAQAARLVAKQDPQVVDAALGAIETAGTEAMVAMRRLVGSMRGEAAAGSSGFTEQATTDLTADLRALAENAAIGLPVRTELDLPGSVPHELGRSVLRLVQESLTNVGKHAASATQATVQAWVRGTELHVRVSDDGTARTREPVGGSGGYGLVGMRERVELLRGRFAAGPAPEGGWRVQAWLPFAEDTEREQEIT